MKIRLPDCPMLPHVLGASSYHFHGLVDDCMRVLGLRECKISDELVLCKVPRWPAGNIGGNVTRGWMGMLGPHEIAEALDVLLPMVKEHGLEDRIEWGKEQLSRGRGRGLTARGLPRAFQVTFEQPKNKAVYKARGHRWRRRRVRLQLRQGQVCDQGSIRTRRP